MSIGSWHGRRILAVWVVAIVLAVAAVRVGDALRATEGDATGFYIGSLFVWIIWLAWLVTWRWTVARKAEVPDRNRRLAKIRLVLVVFGLLWLAATIFEYL